MKNFILMLLVFLCCAVEAQAESPAQFDYGAFSQLPILHEGRVKPLDSFARLKLRALSGQETLKGRPAIEWLAQSLFDPATAAQTPVIAITPGWRETLGLNAGQRFYSLDELLAALQDYEKIGEDLKNADPEKLTPHQQELRNIYNTVIDYNELLRSFSAALPLELDVPNKYKIAKEKNSYIDFLPRQNEMQADIADLANKKGTDLKKYNDTEKRLASFVYALEEIRAAGAGNSAFKIIRANDRWLSPWELLSQENISIKTWVDMADAYRAGDGKAWLSAINAARDNGVLQSRLWLERAYNALNPFSLATGFYLLGMVLLAAEIRRKSNRLTFPFLCLGLALITHTAGIIARIYILERAPVGTLYESLLFVSLICAAAGLILFLRCRNYSVYFAATGSAAFLLFLAPFLIRKGENMETLVAVLNTNFWLGTHVLCITAGYGVAILAAVLAHGWLFLRWKGTSIKLLIPLQSRIYKISLVALLLTSIGTILGGIWADQSWGRFWGWDPKENGALLIVLWIIWIQHGRVSGQLQPNAFIAAVAYLNVIVALAWFGVNLLSVGLHSYGFINGIAGALGLFCVAETALIVALWRLNVRKSNTLSRV